MNLDLWRAALRALMREPEQSISEALYRGQTLLDRAAPLRALAAFLSPCPPCAKCGQPTVPDRLVEVERGRICLGCFSRRTWEDSEPGEVGMVCEEQRTSDAWWQAIYVCFAKNDAPATAADQHGPRCGS